MVTRPRDAAAGAARLPAARRVLRGAARGARRGRGSSALLALAIAGGTGYLLYDKIQDQLNENRPVDGQRRRPAPKHTLAKQQLEAQGFQVRVIRLANARRRDRRGDPAGPGRRRAAAEGLDGRRCSSRPAIPKSTVPDVRGLTQTDAITALVHAGLNANPVLRLLGRAERHRDGPEPRVRARSCSSGSKRAHQRLAGRAAGRRAERRRRAVRRTRRARSRAPASPSCASTPTRPSRRAGDRPGSGRGLERRAALEGDRHGLEGPGDGRGPERDRRHARRRRSSCSTTPASSRPS